MQLRPLPADEGQALAQLLLRLGVGLQRHPRLVDVRVALGGNEKKSISLFAFFFAKLGHENRTMYLSHLGVLDEVQRPEGVIPIDESPTGQVFTLEITP